MTRTYDKGIRPQDDYFGYVNNPWLKRHPIPDTETMWGTFYELRDASARAVDNIVKELRRTPEKKLSHDQRLLRSFFDAALTYQRHAAAHTASLERLLGTIHGIKNGEDLAHALGLLHRLSISVFWTLYVALDDKDSSNEVLRFYQSGLNLPNRDYYLERSPRMAIFRRAYAAYYAAVKSTSAFKLGPWTRVWRVEKRLAEVSWTDVALRDVHNNYTRLSLAKLEKDIPSFDWDAYWCGVGWQRPSDNIVADQYTFVKSCVSLLNELPLADIKAYMSWCVVNSLCSWVSSDLTNLSFDFYGHTLGGQQTIKPLWKRAVLLADRTIIGEALGREYAARHFPETSKQAVSSIVEDIRRAYHSRIDALNWMTETTKQRAHTKLDNMRVFVGYPSVWKDLSHLQFSPDNVIENLLAAHAYSQDLELAKVGNPPADEEWEMNAHTVNAYNHPNRLEIVFPAAILQSPFYDPKASCAANLGGIGAVIGHEFTHGFDDQGCEFDEHGNAVAWQTASERRAFDRLADLVVTQANAFETVPGTFLKGKLILGEAIADIGGLTLAVQALDDPTALPDLFTNFAACECGHSTEQRAIELAKTDPHPPARFRVNCVVNHIDSFYSTYDVQPTDQLFIPKKRRSAIW